MPRFTPLLLFLIFLMTGCHSYIRSPGVCGKIIDADSGVPVLNARVTRRIEDPMMSIRPRPISTTTHVPDKKGRIDVPPLTELQIILCRHNPDQIPGFFIISAPGYATNELHGFATKHDHWRVNLGEVLLKKQ